MTDQEKATEHAERAEALLKLARRHEQTGGSVAASALCHAVLAIFYEGRSQAPDMSGAEL